MKGTRFALAATAALAAVTLTAAPSWAGIVILKNGKVVIGRVEDDTEEELVVRWPYKEKTERGELVVPKFRIRWYHREHDKPTDAYWEEYEDAPIDPKYLPLLEKWRLRQERKDDYVNVPLLLDGSTPKGKLSLRPIQRRHFELRKPEGWGASRSEDGITIFESDEEGTAGFTPRIHVFSVRSIQDATTEEQVEWIEEEVARVGDAGTFEVEESKRPRVVRGGLDTSMRTVTDLDGERIFALRKVCFRDERTYFYTAYAHEEDFSVYGLLFKQCLESLKILEDMSADADEGEGSDDERGASEASSGGGRDGR